MDSDGGVNSGRFVGVGKLRKKPTFFARENVSFSTSFVRDCRLRLSIIQQKLKIDIIWNNNGFRWGNDLILGDFLGRLSRINLPSFRRSCQLVVQ